MELRTCCKCCPATCGIVVDVEDGVVRAVRGDREHPVSRGYTCAKGRGLPWFHHRADRLDHPTLGGVRSDWEPTLDDLATKLRRAIDDHGPDAVAVYWASGVGFDSLGHRTISEFMHAIGSRQEYSAATVDVAPAYRALEMVTGSGGELTGRWRPEDEESRLVLFVGCNPIVSHGYFTILADPVRRIRAFCARGGRVVVVDPRRTETAAPADQHLASRPGTDGAILAWLVRRVIESGHWPPNPDERAGDRERLRDALAPFTRERVSSITGITEQSLEALYEDVKVAGRVAVVTGTGVMFSPHALATELLRLALMIVTDSLDVAGGMHFDPGFLQPTSERAAWDHASEAGRLDPTPASRPELHGLAGQPPAVALVDEIEHGNIAALIVAGGSPLTALPHPDRTAAALRSLAAFAVVDVVDTPQLAYATHVLPARGVLERTDVVSYSGRTMLARSVVDPAPDRRPGWWIFAELSDRLGHGRLDALPTDPFADDAADEVLLSQRLATTPERFAELCAAGSYGVASEYQDGWVRSRALPAEGWRLAPPALLDRLPSLLDEPTPGLRLVSARVVARGNSVQYARPNDSPDAITVNPADAASCHIADGDLVELSSRYGTATGLTVVLDDTIRRGVVAVSHGSHVANACRLTSATDLDTTTSQPTMSALLVELRPTGPPPDPEGLACDG